MYSDSDLEAAVAAGALSPDSAAGLRNFVAGNRSTPHVDEEHFRLLTGFNDIFVAVAAAILLFALGWIGHYIGPNVFGEGPSPTSGILVGAAAWGLAEFFTRKRRMALPSILLLVSFVGAVFYAAGSLIMIGLGEDYLIRNEEQSGFTILAVSAAIAVAAAWLHWRRFMVPITVAVGAAAVVALVMALVGLSIDHSADYMDTIILLTSLVLGLGVFLFAMHWDSSDPRRETRRSDVAFWLHLLSAPLIVHPIFALLGLTEGEASVTEALIVLLVYVLLGLAALAIDRRALLVSALAYVLYALSELFREFGAVELNVALTALVIGSALLLLSAFWHNARRAVVRPLPPSLQARLPVLDRATVRTVPA
ncbi:hypothetical protein [Allosphingosinicella sp.]|jgi:hypothetical protein|uniref:hypothetical protein n=1 Tax=Allosphingosinicella sp. TaxID=2823234 RepID=UPI002EFBC970